MRERKLYRMAGALLDAAGGVRQVQRARQKAAEAAGEGIQNERVVRGLVRAIEANLVNQKEHPFEEVARRYELPVGSTFFKARKRRYAEQLLKELGLYSADESASKIQRERV